MKTPTPDEVIICAAFDRHIRELHPAQFDVCKDSQCQAAVRIEHDMQIIADALARHRAEHGRQSFVTCDDPGCRAAQMVKESAMCYPKGEARNV